MERSDGLMRVNSPGSAASKREDKIMDFFEKFKLKKAASSSAVVRETARGSGFFNFLRIRFFRMLAFLRQKELIGGLCVREDALELALWSVESLNNGTEQTSILFQQSVPLPADTIIEGRIVKKDDFLNACKALFKVAAKASIRSVIISLPDDRAQFVLFSFPQNLTVTQVDEAIELAAESSFPLPKEQVYYDRVLLEGRHEHEVLVGFMRRSDCDGYLDLIAKSGFSSIAVETHSLSVARLFKKETANQCVIFVKPSSVIGIVYHQGFPRLHIEAPRFVLFEKKSAKESVYDELYYFVKRLLHSFESGFSPLTVESVIIISQTDDVGAIGAALGAKGIKNVVLASDALRDARAEKSIENGWDAVLLGVASRGLIPRKSDTLISFMAIGTEQAYEQARFISFIDFLQKFSMSLGAFFVFLFAMSILFVNVLGRSVESQSDDQFVIPVQIVALQDSARRFNEKVRSIAGIHKSILNWEGAFKEIDALLNPGITIVHIEIASGENAVILEGVAGTRNAMIQFKSALENSSVFTFDPLPLSLLLGTEQIRFTVKLRFVNFVALFPKT